MSGWTSGGDKRTFERTTGWVRCPFATPLPGRRGARELGLYHGVATPTARRQAGDSMGSAVTGAGGVAELVESDHHIRRSPESLVDAVRCARASGGRVWTWPVKVVWSQLFSDLVHQVVRRVLDGVIDIRCRQRDFRGTLGVFP